MSAIGIDMSAAEARLDGLAAEVAAKAEDVVARNADALLADIAARTPARLAASFDAESSEDGAARLTSNAPYARLREYGGRIEIPEERPVAAKVLAFPYRGRLVFTRHTAAHDVTMPAEPYLAPALDDIAPQFRADLEAALSELGS